MTLHPDVAAAVKRLRRIRNESLNKLINDALRRGLKQMSARAKPRQPFRTESIDLGRLLVAGIDNIAEVIDAGGMESPRRG